MSTLQFTGFAGHQLEAEMLGHADRPAVLLLANSGQNAAFWGAISEALVLAGRQVIMLQSRVAADGEIFGADVHVADLRAALAQLSSRPMVMGVGRAADIVAAALQDDAGQIAGGAICISEHQPNFAFPAHFPTLTLVGEQGLTGSEEQAEQLLSQLIEFLEEHQPSGPREFRAGSDTRTLRDAMGCFATGVTVVTSVDAEGQPVGLTANSFTSVSLDPPLLLICIANSSSSAAAMRKADKFGVNVLQIGQQKASNRFASKQEDRFTANDWALGETGVPILHNSLVSFECDREALHEAGDHFILIGHVQRAQFEPHRDPLLFFRGKYRRMHFA